jgi:hypothetical protein
MRDSISSLAIYTSLKPRVKDRPLSARRVVLVQVPLRTEDVQHIRARYVWPRKGVCTGSKRPQCFVHPVRAPHHRNQSEVFAMAMEALTNHLAPTKYRVELELSKLHFYEDGSSRSMLTLCEKRLAWYCLCWSCKARSKVESL